MPLRIRGGDTVLRCIALRLWWRLRCIALRSMFLRLRSWFIRHLCIARFIVRLFGGTTHTGLVPTVIAGRLASHPQSYFAHSPHATRRLQICGSFSTDEQGPRNAHRATVLKVQAQESTGLLTLQFPMQGRTLMRNHAAAARRTEGWNSPRGWIGFCKGLNLRRFCCSQSSYAAM